MPLLTLNDYTAGSAAGDRQRFVVNKASVGSLVAGRYGSMWRATGTPGQGAIPMAPAVCSKSDVGAWTFNSPDTANSKALFFTGGALSCSNPTMGFEVHDRLIHMGALSSIYTVTFQLVGIGLTSTSLNLQQRIGPSDLSEIQWWLEIYVTLGSTASTFSVGVTHTDNTSGTISVAVAANSAAGQAYLLAPSVAGKTIKSIDSVTVGTSTGTQGNFGFTATRRLFAFETGAANFIRKLAWHECDFANALENACLTFMTMPTTTSSGSLIGYLNVIHK